MPTRPFIAFDADDTLWPNQPHFDHVEGRMFAILARCGDPVSIGHRLYEVQRRNMHLFGYGAKSLMLAMVETAIQLTDGAVTGVEIQQLLDLGKRLLDFPIEPLPGVLEVLTELKRRGERLMVLTKGDLFDQESKLARSGLGDFFDYVEIVSEKNEATYRRILARHGVAPADFLMIGNSLKSDILPVLALGAQAIHVPYHTTWIHEEVPAEQLVGLTFPRVEALTEVLAYLS
ncbi:HAD hydrolase-like protein [Hymenobacter sp. HMF4947]|uniref:HAD hydrolase-like protein n=1 Tax=Hymenobacter ginkgonis TaxID=2682976 RepID=A0A7K1TBP8_9BACT|nr:HAD family hydrolase [Hymenobacter ginkgonis]MVN75732.1 HAD hydrolase-like protein [Hymenobacter ginkgonis]